MNGSFLDAPRRDSKPRSRGLTSLLDAGVPHSQFRDVIESSAPLIDFVKFGWCTALVTSNLDRKIEVLRANEVRYFFGGTLFEKAYVQGKIGSFLEFARRNRCEYVEVSNGTADISNEEKCRYIRELSREFKIRSEVGFKDAQRSERLYPERWISFIRDDLAAGTERVITEARESGTSGICRPTGELRLGLIEEIANAGIEIDRLVFEAPNKYLQTFFVQRFGCDVNLGNVAFTDVIALETLRLGLRADTFSLFDGGA